MIEWDVYMVRCSDGSLYTGITKDVKSRVSLHNAGRGAKYTRARRPVELVYRETVGDRGAALRREYAIKRLRPIAKKKLITKFTESESTR
ncbi:MAG: GIY-YIG nuclease family protein [Deltaproteobacteria bacterium]|nr:GIY-YIG nuclease family protein [Deltaproteobacteria bacterium]